MNTRTAAVTGSTAPQPAQGVSFNEIFREARGGLAVAVGLLLGLFGWSHFPGVMTIIGIVAGVLAFIIAVSELAVRFGPSPEAVVAMSLSGREMRAAIRDY